MSESSITDSKVLQQTKFSAPDAKGRVQLGFVLPSGRKVTSTDWLVPGEIKGKVLIAWANAIRAEDAFDIQQREEQEKLARAEKRARELSSDARGASSAPALPAPSSGPSGSSLTDPAGTSPSSSTQSSILPDDPRQMMIDKLGTLIATRKAYESQRDVILEKLEEVKANISRWESIVDSLGGRLPPSETPQSPSSAAESPSTCSSEPTTSNSSPRQSRAQRRKNRKQKGDRHESQVGGGAGASQGGVDNAEPRGHVQAGEGPAVPTAPPADQAL